MILTPHILTGVLLIKLFPSSPWIFLIILISHYLLDMLPHWEYVDEGLDFRKAAWRIGLDLFIGFSLVFVLISFSWWLALGIFFSILPDLPILLFSFFKTNKFLKSYFDFNDTLHFWHPSPVWLGILTQAIVVLVYFVLI